MTLWFSLFCLAVAVPCAIRARNERRARRQRLDWQLWRIGFWYRKPATPPSPFEIRAFR